MSAAPYPVATPADVFASLEAYVALLDLAMLRGVPVAELVEHFGRIMEAARFVLVAMSDDVVSTAP